MTDDDIIYYVSNSALGPEIHHCSSREMIISLPVNSFDFKFTMPLKEVK